MGDLGIYIDDSSMNILEEIYIIDDENSYDCMNGCIYD